MKYYIIAGEASGDLHGSNLINELLKLDTSAQIRGWGGDKMEAAGATIAKHYRDLAFMGFAEIVKNLPAILKNITFCKQDISSFKPDVVVLINYSAFNLRIAEWTKKNNFRNVFYISPQVWAWKESRIKTIKKYVDKMIVILPFEKQFYKTWDYEVDYVGHPLVQVVDNFKACHPDIEESINTIALLPGSRKQEIKTKLPLMLEVTKNFPENTFIVAKAPSIPDEFYEPFLKPFGNVKMVSDDTYALLMQAYAALVTSGTATLETALFGVPEIVCYKAGSISYSIAKRLIKLKYISLVNLIMNKEVVKELIQDQLTPQNITRELNEILYDPVRREKIQFEYYLLKKQLSESGDASANAAKIVYESV
ncbi:MAG: lipid-A-disaccharide synthase [Ginsengibacter sp.]